MIIIAFVRCVLNRCSPQLFQKEPKHILKIMDSLKDVSVHVHV